MITNRSPDRLFSRPSTLTDDERERARAAIEARPAILEQLYATALGTLDHGERTAEQIIAEVQRCAS